MINKKKAAAALLVLCVMLTGCGGKKDPEETTAATTVSHEAAKPDFSTASESEESMTIYTGREVENEEDRAIYKFSCTPPEGYKTIIDSGEGKQFANETGGIVVKAQNFKEEFQELEVFADSGCFSISYSNMLQQADTEFSEPVKTKVAGFDAIRYDYTVTAYEYLPMLDDNGEQVLDENGIPRFTDERKVHGVFKDRVYYFYSDEDVFYIICESTEDSYEKASKEFDEFIESVSITKK